ncbi:hypothetical protein MBLNU457_2314t1 [Dothideomycetes sp. NU457]
MLFGKKHIIQAKKARGAVQQEDGFKPQQTWTLLEAQTYQRAEQNMTAAPSIPLRSPARPRPQSCTSITSISTGSSRASEHRHSQYVPGLKRKYSPTCETLRELRAKQSEAALRNAYEAQTLAYLSDSYRPRPTRSRTQGLSWSGSESSAEDYILEEEEEDEDESPAPGTQGWWTSSIYSPTPGKEWSLPG